MHSDKSVGGDRWTPEFQKGDAVLDVADISRYGRKLGDDVTEATVTDGLHDLVLSAPKVRHGVYRHYDRLDQPACGLVGGSVAGGSRGSCLLVAGELQFGAAGVRVSWPASF